MKIYLYLSNKIMMFTIPSKISGSFSFDEDPDEESKLINIEARDSQWMIYSTVDVGLLIGGAVTSCIKLEPNSYYQLRRSGKDYLIYVTDSFDNSFSCYLYNENISLVVGNDESCNIKFDCPFISGVAKINCLDKKLLLDVSNILVYVNNNSLTSSQYEIISGDQINIFGLKIVFFNGFLLINNPMNKVSFNFASCNLSNYQLSSGDSNMDIDVKDVELYGKDDYFSKSPRIRRLIKTKEITLSPPPKQEGEKKMPLLLTVGPMLTMGVTSCVMLINTVSKIASGSTNLKSSWPSLASSIAMLISTLLWPTLTKIFDKKIKKQNKKELVEKYSKYLDGKKQELANEVSLQRDILIENLISVDECINIINVAKINFWDKRIEQNDFLVVRVGVGNELLDAKVNYPEEGFTIDEDELRKQADMMVESFKYIQDVPIGYSLYENKITAIMGDGIQPYGFINNVILQLITFYSYDDVKIVLFTNEVKKNNWDYLRYLNHCFSNDKRVRFFSTSFDNAKKIGDYLNYEIQNRIQLISDGPRLFKPHYLVITDDYEQIKNQSFVKSLTEIDANLGFSLILIEKQMSKMPSKCNNFISLNKNESSILKNSFESQEFIKFHDEINYNINMMQVAKKLSNIPIEFEEGNKQLPDSITFLGMEKVGKVEQLNIMNRWDSNDSTSSLRAEIGIDSQENLIYLDLHEKFHGPHGLIAGTTGSGKSEFIITYVLSMCINYSPDDVSFILIDYKGGGLALAFENKSSGVVLPHLAGTITNLDKAEMDRTLVSIKSEAERRQKLFNEAKDKLGESTMDIYKYQRHFHEGNVAEPISHLFIICDEFAELKSQQPEFMDDLISIARIGRSLGVHLILATQKPSGVVNDQIWSNTRFRVCLKVQSEADSKEMLKNPDAAHISQAGRFYLQVGYDEVYSLGQSGWCGAKYYPSEKIIKEVDKSVNFIDDVGNTIKSIKAGNNVKIEAQGEQLAAVLNNIIEVAKATNRKSRRLWLTDIEPVILIDNLERKYNFVSKLYDVKAIIGEYDAPEKQEQGLLVYSVKNEGNTVIFGNDEVEREKLLNTIIYSISKNHTTKEVNFYVIDFGSESMRVFSKLPQFGGMVFIGEDEKFWNLFKLINNEIKERKKKLIDYGGSIEVYNNKNEEKLPQIIFVLNNYDAILESYANIYEDLSSIGRDCERYGVVLLLTCSLPSTLGRRAGQCFTNRYGLHLTDTTDYYGIFNMKCNVYPKDTLGRGVANNDGIHEFQTASIVDDNHSINDVIDEVVSKIKSVDDTLAIPIPSLPERVTYDIVKRDIVSIKKVPIGVSKSSLKIIKYDFSAFSSTTIVSNKLQYINSFMDSLMDVFLQLQDVSAIFFMDVNSLLQNVSEKQYNNKKISYFNSNFEEVIVKLTDFQKNPDNKKYRLVYVFYGLEKLKSKVDVKNLENLFKEIKSSENSTMLLCEGSKMLKTLEMDSWYSSVKSNSDGIWIGKGFGDQQNFRISKMTKEMTVDYSNSYGFCLREGSAELMKVLEFNELLNQEDDVDGE